MQWLSNDTYYMYVAVEPILLLGESGWSIGKISPCPIISKLTTLFSKQAIAMMRMVMLMTWATNFHNSEEWKLTSTCTVIT